jgi:hypothetical protein
MTLLTFGRSPARAARASRPGRLWWRLRWRFWRLVLKTQKIRADRVIKDYDWLIRDLKDRQR